MNHGMLLVPGWQDQSRPLYDAMTADLGRRGWACGELSLPSSSWTDLQRQRSTRQENLDDLLRAHDELCARPGVDRDAMALVGVSYGGYLAALASALRPVRWLVLRAPALYSDEGWHVPKEQLDKDDQQAVREQRLGPEDNRALAACAQFRGDVLLIESENDKTIPHQVVENFKAAFRHARSLSWRVLDGADHELSQDAWRQAFRALAVSWLTDNRESHPRIE